ncbi:MAG: ComF family protein [Flavobacterium sp.]|nr:ComF family protein [Flavobacterium sp.]
MFKSLIDLFYPMVCCGCDAILLTGEITICTECRHNIPLSNHHLHPENEAFQKFYGRLPVESAMAMMLFKKSGIVQQMIHKLKYRGQQQIGTEIGKWYGDELRACHLLTDIDQIVPVPLHLKRLRERGYNQVSSFGKALADKLDVPMNESLLCRNLYTKTQTKKNLLGRSDLKTALFSANFTAANHGQHFLLIDDVLTTGATLEACGKALLAIPDAKISIACMAMSHS